MYKEEITHYSQCLSRDMHIMIYGHGGVPFLAFPTQDSLCHNYEDFGMIDVLSDYLEEGIIVDDPEAETNATASPEAAIPSESSSNAAETATSEIPAPNESATE